MSHALWVLREVGPLNTRSKDSLLKALLKAPALPAIFLLFPRTRFPALPSAPFAEELPELPMLPGQIGHLLPEEREPLKTACFLKQMRHKNDRAVLTRLPHPVRHNRSACFITEIRVSNWNCQNGKIPTEPGQHMWFQMCVCVCVFLRLCVCVCVCVRACWNASVCRNPRIHVSPPRVHAILRAFIKLWCITYIAHSFVIALAGPKTQSWHVI